MNFLKEFPNRYYLLGFGALLIYFILMELGIYTRLGYIIENGLVVILIYGFFSKNGVYVSTKWFQRSSIFVPFILIGALFKIQHYPYVIELFAIGFGGLTLSYGLHFLDKKNKIFLDYLKTLWIFIDLGARFLIINHYNYGHELKHFLSPLLLFSIIILTVKTNITSNKSWLDN